MGRDHVDAVRLRKRWYDRWVAHLDRLADGYDFEVESRRLAEHALITDFIAVLPITGADIMEHLGTTPGPEVGRLLQRAADIHKQSPHTGTG